MADNEIEAPTQSHPRRRRLVWGRRSRLLVAFLAVATAGVLALTLTIGSAGAQSGDSIGVTEQQQTEEDQYLVRDHHDEVTWAHHEGESRGHHDEVTWVHHEGESRGHHDGATRAHHDGESRDHHEDCDYHGGRFGHRVAVNAVAELLGLDPETLCDKMVDGETLADIAAGQGVEVSDLINVIVAAVSDHAAEHGHEIDTGALTEKVTELVNGEHPERPGGKNGWNDRRGLHRWGGHIGSHSSVSAT